MVHRRCAACCAVFLDLLERRTHGLLQVAALDARQALDGLARDPWQWPGVCRLRECHVLLG